MTNNVYALKKGENPCIRVEAIHELQNALGLEATRDVIERAVLEISDCLCRLETAVAEGNQQEVARLASGLVAVSIQIGMTSFATVAQQLVECTQGGDVIAFHAVSARLVRIGEASLFYAMEYSGGSG